MATTDIGKYLRKLRVDHDERLLDMASRLGMSSAFISNIETGKKSPPVSFEEHVIVGYELDIESAQEVKNAADRSRSAFRLEANSPLQRDTAGLMARKMSGLSPDELNNILSILRNSEGKEQ